MPVPKHTFPVLVREHNCQQLSTSIHSITRTRIGTVPVRVPCLAAPRNSVRRMSRGIVPEQTAALAQTWARAARLLPSSASSPRRRTQPRPTRSGCRHQSRNRRRPMAPWATPCVLHDGADEHHHPMPCISGNFRELPGTSGHRATHPLGRSVRQRSGEELQREQLGAQQHLG